MKEEIERLAEVLNIKIDKEDGSFFLYSPKGTIFSSNKSSLITAIYEHHGEDFSDEAYESLMEDLEHGIEPADEDYNGWWS